MCETTSCSTQVLKTLEKSQYANESVACRLLTFKTFKGENLEVNKPLAEWGWKEEEHVHHKDNQFFSTC
jgi:hypothetical protein